MVNKERIKEAVFKALVGELQEAKKKGGKKFLPGPLIGYLMKKGVIAKGKKGRRLKSSQKRKIIKVFRKKARANQEKAANAIVQKGTSSTRRRKFQIAGRRAHALERIGNK
jgi:hypothetical protein